MSPASHRLLEHLLATGLAPDERTARGLLMRGDVLVNDVPVSSPAQMVSEGDNVRIRGTVERPASRGYDKLAPVLDELGIKPQGKVALDLGVSTGGFSQVLLERGVAKLYAVDVAYGVTADNVRNDPRVLMLERTNARELDNRIVPEPLGLVIGDLSFISWSAVLPAVSGLLAADAELLLLIKPQFELSSRGRGDELEDGIVANAGLRQEALEMLWDTWHNVGLCPRAVLPSALKGMKGNQEYFIHLVAGTEMCTEQEYRNMVAAAAGREAL